MKIFYLIIFLIGIGLIWHANLTFAVTSSPVTTAVGSPGPSSTNSSTTGGASGPFTFYCQHDSQWSGTPYSCETISRAGCGPTSFAMVLSTFGLNYNPAQAAKLMTDNHFNTCGQGSAMEPMLLSRSFLASIGLEASQPLTDIQTGRLKTALAAQFVAPDQHALIIGSADHFPGCGGCGHIFVVDKIDVAANTVTIRDPNNCSGDGQERATGRVYSTTSFSWKYAYSVKRIGT